jgi:hypothetical protein
VKVKLQAGAELDVISPQEAREIVVELLEQERARGHETFVRADESAVTDAAGNAVITVYTCPVGKVFRITRLVVDADGFTPGAPFKAATGFIAVLRSGEVVDFVNLSNGIPALSTDNADTGARWRNGEQVQVQISGGPANTTVRAKVQGFEKQPARHGQAGRTRMAPGGGG